MQHPFRREKKYVKSDKNKGEKFNFSDCAANIYLIVMFSVFPYFYLDAYYDIGYYKYEFFKYATLAFIAASVIGIFLKGGGFYKTLFKPDCFVLAYGVSVIISFLFCIDRETGLYGEVDWRMGLISQCAFIFLYFIISRKWSWRDYIFPLICICSAGVFLLGILNRFYIDPLNMYEGMDEEIILLFLSTIGQSTWYSSFVCVVFSVGIFLFWKKPGWLSAGYMVLAFGAIVTSNSDSALAALGVVLLMLMWRAFRSSDDWKRFILMLMVMFGTFLCLGILRRLFPAVELGGLPTFLLDWKLALPAVIILCAGYWLWSGKQFKWNETVMVKIRNVVYIITGTAFLGLLVFIVLNSMNGWVRHNYLLFNESFGNNRGFTWTLTVRLYKEFPFLRKLFGAGPDCYAAAVYSVPEFASQLNHLWGEDIILTCAHNEALNMLICYGLVGAAAYYGIFAAGLKSCLKKPGINEEFAIAMCIAAYLAHNFFCYQQVVCTPLIFILMGMAQSRLISEEDRR